jgi:hypothetical protein
MNGTLLLAASLCTPRVPAPTAWAASSSQAAPFSDAALELLRERTGANEANFYIYKNADSGFNHGIPSGFFGAIGQISLDTACVFDPSAPNGCSTSPNYLDSVHGTVVRLTFGPLAPGQYAGLNFEEPEHWGVTHAGNGYDLTPASMLRLDAWSPNGATVKFGLGLCTTPFVTIPGGSQFTSFAFPISTPQCQPDLHDVHVLLTIVTNAARAPTGATVLFDNVRVVPIPDRQHTLPLAYSFPTSTETFGSLATASPMTSCSQLPPRFSPDQALRNLSTTYESACASIAGAVNHAPADIPMVDSIARAIDYALHHDNQGDPIPPAAGGHHGLHNGYEDGDIGLQNNQGGGGGLAGQVRLAGFTGGAACGPSHYCLVLDGATGGNNAFAILALLQSYKLLGNAQYLADAIEIGQWIVANLEDTTGSGFGGYYLGYPDEGIIPKPLLKGKSTENCADIFAALWSLAGFDSASATFWREKAKVAGDFVVVMYDPAQSRFAAGTVPVGTPASPGIDPTGPTQGQDVVNKSDFLDATTFSLLALAGSTTYGQTLDWHGAFERCLVTFAETVSTGTPAAQFSGVNIVASPVCGTNGIAWEFTGQVAECARFLDELDGTNTYASTRTRYLRQIKKAQAQAPFADGRGLVASTLQNGDALPPFLQCLETPFQCIPERVGIAATAWGVFADLGINPLATVTP